MKDKLQPYPTKESVGDYAVSAAKVIIGMTPMVGSSLTEVFDRIFTSPIKERQAKAINLIIESVNELRANGHTEEALKNNPQFISAVMQVVPIIFKSHQQEKIERLKNCLKNSTSGTSIEEAEHQMFISYVDSFTEWHFRLIVLMNDPDGWFDAKGLTKKSTGSPSEIVYMVYPELQDNFLRFIWKDIQDKGLANRGLHGMMTTGWGSNTTDMGKKFVKFIS